MYHLVCEKKIHAFVRQIGVPTPLKRFLYPIETALKRFLQAIRTFVRLGTVRLVS